MRRYCRWPKCKHLLGRGFYGWCRIHFLRAINAPTTYRLWKSEDTKTELTIEKMKEAFRLAQETTVPWDVIVSI